MSRRVYLLGGGLALVALAFVVTAALLGPSPGVTPANVRRIKPGMTLEEVETVFGKPAGSIMRFDPCCPVKDEPLPPPGPWLALWSDDNGLAMVTFNGKNRVEQVEFRPLEARPTSSPLTRLREWLGW
jgi:hypothetical protein